MKKHILPVILIYAMLLSGCVAGAGDENEASASPEIPTFEEILAMSDIELGKTLCSIELTEEDGAYYLAPSVYKDWEPTIVEGWPLSETPIENRVIVHSSYGEADIEEAALMMAKRFIHYMMNAESLENTTYMITAYKDLSVKVYTLDELPEKYSQHIEREEGLSEDTTSPTWYIVPSVSYKFVGEIKGIGSDKDLDEDKWVTDLGGNGEICLSLSLHEFDEDKDSIYSMGSVKPV